MSVLFQITSCLRRWSQNSGRTVLVALLQLTCAIGSSQAQLQSDSTNRNPQRQFPTQNQTQSSNEPQLRSGVTEGIDSTTFGLETGSGGVQLVPPREVNGDLPVGDQQNQIPESITVPLTRSPLPERTTVSADGEYVTLVVRDASLGAVLNAIAEEMNLNVVSSGDIEGLVSITLNRVPLQDALDAVLSVNGYRWILRKNIILVSSLEGSTQLSPQVHGRELRVFNLNFVAATDINTTVQSLLSPVGVSNVTEIDTENKLRTREEIVVEDMPEYLDRIQAYILQADQPPQQVLIEAHVLQVQLTDDNKHGVNLGALAKLASSDVTLATNGIASTAATPAFLLNIEGNRVGSIIELIQSTTDAKTLASPRVLAVNGQEARIQIGEQLGYLTTTTTQTSTLQDVQFIDLGVVLTVTPVISRDGQILMTVKPEVSSGRINGSTGLPDSETTEVTTTVLLPDGNAMVIGGLIKEENSDQQSKLPVAGNIPLIGKLFQRRLRLKNRSEIIIVLTPRIVPYGEYAQCKHAKQVHQATTPLVYGPLIPVDRRAHEADLPNSIWCGRDDPYGKRMNRFPTPPVAYSPYNSNFAQSRPPTSGFSSANRTDSHASQSLPPAANRSPQAIRQTNATRSTINFNNRVRQAANMRRGWQATQRR